MMRLLLLACMLAPFSAEARRPHRAPHPPPRPCLARPADTIYYNGVIETLDRRFSRGEAIALWQGRVLWVGPNRPVLALFRGCGTKLIDLKGGTVLPGFVDAHTHAFASTFWNVPPPDTEEEALDWLRNTQRLQLMVGITTQAEALVSPGLAERLQALAAAHDLIIRTTLYMRRTGNCQDIFDDLDGFSPEPSVAVSPRIPGIKIFADGAANNPCGFHPATTFEQLGHDPAPFFGDLLFDQATMDDLVQTSDAAGWQIIVHSIGDRSRDQVLGAYSTILAGDGHNPRRHRIEHNNWIRPDQIDAYRENGIIPVVFGYQFTCNNNAGLNPVLNSAPDKSWYQPYRTMLAAGLRLAWHGDWTYAEIAPDEATLDTWMSGMLSSLVTRKEFLPGETCLPQPWAAAETITIRQALRLVTTSAAYAIGMESVVGSLEPGKHADMIIVSEDPLTADPDSLHEMHVLATIIGGVPRSCSAALSSLCP